MGGSHPRSWARVDFPLNGKGRPHGTGVVMGWAVFVGHINYLFFLAASVSPKGWGPKTRSQINY